MWCRKSDNDVFLRPQQQRIVVSCKPQNSSTDEWHFFATYERFCGRRNHSKHLQKSVKTSQGQSEGGRFKLCSKKTWEQST